MIRALEDKNLELTYTINNHKRKETQYIDQIAKLKAQLKRYTEQDKFEVHAPKSKSLRPSTLNNLRFSPDGENTSTANSDSFALSQHATPNHREHMLRRGMPISMVMDLHPGEDTIGSEPELDFKARRSEVLRSLQNLDVGDGLNLEENTKVRFSRGNSRRDWNLKKDLDEAISEESVTPTLAPSLEKGIDEQTEKEVNSPEKKEVMNDLNIANIKRKTSILTLPSAEECKCKLYLITMNNLIQ